MMEQFEIPANEWLKKEQNELNCSVEIKNGALHFTVEKTINFSINIDSDANTWMVWSDHSSIQPHLGSILEYCESSKPENIELLLEKMFKIINESIQKCSSKDDDEEDDDEDYYNYDDDGEDDGIEKPNEEKPNERNDMDSESEDSEDERFFEGRTNSVACYRLMKDLRSMRRDAGRFCIEGTPRGNNLFIWDVKLTNFPTETRLGQDIKAWAEKSHREPVVYLEMQFPGDFPMNPPFVRVIRPRFKFLTGHVTIGGSICMEMLTSTGWTPTNDIEGILVQIRSEIMSDPNTRLDHDPDKEYNELEARNAFDRMVQRYGWK